MSLTRAEWTQIEALFPEALALAVAQRAQFLERSCRDQPQIRAEIESLLVAAESGGNFFDRPVTVMVPTAMDATLAAGSILGPWRVLELVGRGGMGEVYLAERADGAFAMRVAVKLLKRGLDSDAIARRFLRERRILAQLSHPNIAHLLDAGVADDGRPYLVMEYVRGESITAYCESRALPLPEILRLMRAICEAVDEAHRHLVVHRDLKPSNVLVTAEGEIKLLDFGIAKLLVEDDPDATGATRDTAPLSPSFAAPEQILGGVISTATDVYALGALLYLLVTGRLPHQRELPLAAIALGIKDETTERPSAAVLNRSTASLADRKRRARELAGDLDLIVLKALHSEPARRYRSARELGEDLRRHLEGWPVRARPDSTAYRIDRFVRRHQLPVAAGTAVALALVVGLAAALWQARVARLAEQREKQEREMVQAREVELSQVVRFQSDMLKRVSVEQLGARLLDRMRVRIAEALHKRGVAPAESDQLLASFDRVQPMAAAGEAARQALAASLLAPAEKQIETDFAQRPETEVALRRALGETYVGLGLFADARRQYERAIALDESLPSMNGEARLEDRGRLALTMDRLGDQKAQRAYAETLFQDATQALGADHPQTLRAHMLVGLALFRGGDYKAAQAALESTLARQRALLGPDHKDTQETGVWLVGVLIEQGDARALPLADEIFNARLRDLGAENTDTLASEQRLATVYNKLGQNERSVEVSRDVWTIRKRVLGDDHPLTLQVEGNLGTELFSLGRLDETERVNREVWQGLRKVLGDDHPSTLIAANNYATALNAVGRAAEARDIIEEVVRIRAANLGPEHPRTLYAMNNLAMTYRRLKDYPRAIALHQQVLAAQRKVLGVHNPDANETARELGKTYAEAGHPAESERLLRDLLAELEADSSVEHEQLKEVADVLVEVLQLNHQPQQAAEVAQRYGVESNSKSP